VCSCSAVTILLRQSEVDNEYLVAVPTNSHHKVVRLDVAMDEVFAVHVLDAADHLVGQHQHRLHRKTAGAEIEEVLKTRTEQLHNEYVVVANLAKPTDVWDAHAALQQLVQLALVQQLRMSSFYWF